MRIRFSRFLRVVVAVVVVVAAAAVRGHVVSLQ
jgi:hypothetical protein